MKEPPAALSQSAEDLSCLDASISKRVACKGGLASHYSKTCPLALLQAVQGGYAIRKERNDQCGP